MTLIVSLVVVNFCLMAYADDASMQMSLLEQRAQRINSQIDQAKQQAAASTDGQIKALNASIDGLVKQRVQLDSAISRLEGQVADLRQSADASLSRQTQQYQTELETIKQQMASLASKKSADASQKTGDPAQSAAVSQTVTAPPATPDKH